MSKGSLLLGNLNNENLDDDTHLTLAGVPLRAQKVMLFQHFPTT